MGKQNKKELAVLLGISRSSLYYKPKQPEKDWQLKCDIENVLRIHNSYGHKRLALHLGINKKRVLRVMKLFGIKPYRRRGRRWKQQKGNLNSNIAPNLLLANSPEYPNHIWVADFSHVNFGKTIVYIATVMDLFTRKIVGFSVMTNHSVQLVIGALFSAIHKHPPPEIFHSDRGSEYTSKDMKYLLHALGIKQSMSAQGCPWENGYQESFYSQFKIDLGDPNRFECLGQLVYEIYKTIYIYNNSRIHTAIKMPPETFAVRYEIAHTFV